MRFRPQAKGQQLGGGLTVWRLVSLTPHCEWRQWSCSSRASGIWPPASLPVSHCNCTKTEENNTDRSEVFRFFVAVIFIYPPIVGVFPALVDGIWTTIFVCQFSLFVHVGSSYQFDSQTKTFFSGLMQSFYQQGSGLLEDTDGEGNVSLCPL